MKLRYGPTILFVSIKTIGDVFQSEGVYWPPDADTSVIDCGVSLAKVPKRNMPKKPKMVAALYSKWSVESGQ